MLKAKVIFPSRFDKDIYGGKHYDYFTNIKDLEEGDLVVVETQYGFSVAKFIRYTDKFKVKATKHIVQKVNLEEFLAEKERLKKIRDLEEQISHKAEQANKREIYNQLAENDDELKTLLDTLDSLQK